MKSTTARLVPQTGQHVFRSVASQLGRLLFPRLLRLSVSGMENVPLSGPLLIAANHVGALEVALLATLLPRAVEFVGAGDIPLDPTLAPIARWWGFIPIRRGTLDRSGLRHALETLQRGSALVVFPEGGIWNPGKSPARIGISWLSHQSGAPIIPVAFDGGVNALKEALTLQRPPIRLIAGRSIPALNVIEGNKRAAYDAYARQVGETIRSLLSTGDVEISDAPEERFEFALRKANGQSIQLPDGDALGRFLTQPVLIDTLHRNLRLPIDALMRLGTPRRAGEVSKSCRVVLAYLEENPGFFTYRFGMDQGLAVGRGLSGLADECEQLDGLNENVTLSVQRQIRNQHGAWDVVGSGGISS